MYCEPLLPAFAVAIAEMRAAPAPGDVLRRLLAAHPGMPRLLRLAESIPAGPSAWHSGSTLTHMVRVMNAVAGDPLAVWMAFAHDLGKLTTPRDLWPHHYGHELRGVVLARLYGQRAGLPPEEIEAGCFCACQHMRAARLVQMKPRKRRALALLVDDMGLTRPFWSVVDADAKAPVSLRAREELLAALEARTQKTPQGT